VRSPLSQSTRRSAVALVGCALVPSAAAMRAGALAAGTVQCAAQRSRTCRHSRTTLCRRCSQHPQPPQLDPLAARTGLVTQRSHAPPAVARSCSLLHHPWLLLPRSRSHTSPASRPCHPIDARFADATSAARHLPPLVAPAGLTIRRPAPGLRALAALPLLEPLAVAAPPQELAAAEPPWSGALADSIAWSLRWERSPLTQSTHCSASLGKRALAAGRPLAGDSASQPSALARCSHSGGPPESPSAAGDHGAAHALLLPLLRHSPPLVAATLANTRAPAARGLRALAALPPRASHR
jgi:hypothetical protein